MATTSQSHTGDGSTTDYTLQFSYVKQSDVKATLDGTATTAFTFANATTLSFNTAPANGVAIKITRETDVTNIKATFFPGSAIKAEDLNGNFEQTLFVSQESNNLATASSTDVSTALDNSSTALSQSTTALSTANNASNAVSNVVPYNIVANVTSLPSSAQDASRYEVADSTNAESTSNITGLPSNFVGAIGLNLRLQYSTNSSNFVFVDYIVQDPDSRYTIIGKIPQNLQTSSSSYPLVSSDAGKHVNTTNGGVTVPSGVFSTGDAVSIYNDSASNQTITQAAGVTLRQAGTSNIGDRTLAQRGICTVLCVASNEFVICGTGVT